MLHRSCCVSSQIMVVVLKGTERLKLGVPVPLITRLPSMLMRKQQAGGLTGKAGKHHKEHKELMCGKILKCYGARDATCGERDEETGGCRRSMICLKGPSSIRQTCRRQLEKYHRPGGGMERVLILIGLSPNRSAYVPSSRELNDEVDCAHRNRRCSEKTRE